MSALAYNLAELVVGDHDADALASLTKECSGCDPDNPRAVRREDCQKCGGTGREQSAALAIVAELREAHTEEPKAARGGSGSGGDDDDLYLEY